MTILISICAADSVARVVLRTGLCATRLRFLLTLSYRKSKWSLKRVNCESDTRVQELHVRQRYS